LLILMSTPSKLAAQASDLYEKDGGAYLYRSGDCCYRFQLNRFFLVLL
jgi:hypothetical protein